MKKLMIAVALVLSSAAIVAPASAETFPNVYMSR